MFDSFTKHCGLNINNNNISCKVQYNLIMLSYLNSYYPMTEIGPSIKLHNVFKQEQQCFVKFKDVYWLSLNF